MTMATRPTTQVTHGGVPVGDRRERTTAASTSRTSAVNVIVKARFERRGPLGGGWNTGSVVAAPHL